MFFKMLLSALVALVAFALVANAQRPQACESPEQWGAAVSKIIHNKNVTHMLRHKLSYDALHQRLHIYVDEDVSGKHSVFEYIMLYREKRVYRIELSAEGKKECTVHKLYNPFRAIRIPSDYNYTNEAYIGGSFPGTGLLVNVFYGDNYQSGIGQVSYVTSVTAEACLPVHSWLYDEKHGGIHSSYYNIVLGIEDPSRFIPPSDCKQGFLEPDDMIYHMY